MIPKTKKELIKKQNLIKKFIFGDYFENKKVFDVSDYS